MTSLYLSPQLRDIEAHFSNLPLMARAGQAAAELARQLIREPSRPILVLAGPGNNGGDAFVAAEQLLGWGHPVHLVFAGKAERLPADAAAARRSFISAGGKAQADLAEDERYALIIDGLFGIGLSRAPEGRYACLIERCNGLAAAQGCPVLALDCPSGLNADTGQTPGDVVRASHTISFIADKPGLHTLDGPDCCGSVCIADLGLDLADFPPPGQLLEHSAFAAHLQPRRRNTHKGSYGSAGVLGGASSMLGAALLAARAALKIGAGRVYCGLLGAPDWPVDPVQPELMLRQADALLGLPELSALACGPGLGQAPAAGEYVASALRSALPLVLDADALNLIAAQPALAQALRQRQAPSLLTPHPAEAARLLACDVATIQANRIATACRIARDFRSHVVLKGCGSVVARPDGQWWINPTGHPGMATAGMGDVLCGLLVGLLAQGWPADAALLAAVHLHGAAAERLQVEGIGPIGLTAGEVADAARRVFNFWVSQAGAR